MTAARRRLAAALVIATVALPVARPSAAAAPAQMLPGSGGYPRAIVLHQADPSGSTILETDTDGFMSGTQRFFRSNDGGQTFEQLPSLQVTGVIHGTDVVELPVAAGDLAAGTLLLALAVNPTATYPPDAKDAQMEIPVYSSPDDGQTWTLRSRCTRTNLPDGTTGGLWEPELHVADDGSLVCLYSDETQRPTHSQVLTQVISSDGGATWSTPKAVVATPDPLDRPGMPTVARMGDGRWAMTYEDCGLRHLYCRVLIRFGPDGIRWGDPARDGIVVLSDLGSHFSSAPTVAWSSTGGTDGTLLVVGRILDQSNGFADPGNGVVVLANDTGGAGPWVPIPAPVPLAHPDPGDDPVNYSSPLVPLTDGGLLGFAAQRTDRNATLTVRFGITSIPNPLPAPRTPSTTTTTTTTPAVGTPSAPPAIAVPATASFTG